VGGVTFIDSGEKKITVLMHITEMLYYGV